MGIFDKFKGHGRHRAGKSSASAEQRTVEKTGGRYEDQIDAAQQRVEGSLRTDRDRDRHEHP
ncbi:antitoxin [Streptomyces sp. NPDC019990]|uniref:antitoxin n=1 Tax=Streptomyces sp. NPDC019990 TaxID=3154693 RepID=UPI0033D50B96